MIQSGNIRISTPTIAQKQKGLGFGIMTPAITLPPACNIVTGELTGIPADTQVQITRVAFQIEQAVGNDQSLGRTVEIMIICLDHRLGVQPPLLVNMSEPSKRLGLFFP